MFQRKKKTRVEQAREDLQKQLRVVNKQAKDTRKDFVKRLNRTADDLRSDIQHLFNGEEKKQANKVAVDLERIAHQLEDQAEHTFEEVGETVSENKWTLLLMIFAIGIVLGIIFKQLTD